MKRIIISLICFLVLSIPVSAMEYSAPDAPDAAQRYLDEETESFSDGLWHILKNAIHDLQPEIAQASQTSLALIAVTVLTALVQSMAISVYPVVDLVGTIGIAGILLKPACAYIELGIDTVRSLSEYGKMLIPVMTSALAAQGGATSAVAIYTATAVFDAVLSTGIVKIMIPMIYVFMCLCIVNSSTPNAYISNIQDFIKWAMTWTIKTVLYVFTGYITISGIISGTVDASAIKAAKIAISGTVPVVGNIISDASEAILVSAGIMKNAAGIYGILVIIALYVLPFLQLGFQHILLKLTAAICSVIGSKRCVSLINDFSTVLGFLLAMTGAICLLHLISTVCFIKGVA